MSDDVADQIIKKPPTSHWYPGMPSPNPGGRRKSVAHLQELAREHTPAALAKIVELMNDEKTSRITALACARELLDRAYGTPPQSIAVTSDPDMDRNEVPIFEVARRLAFLLHAGVSAGNAVITLPVQSNSDPG